MKTQKLPKFWTAKSLWFNKHFFLSLTGLYTKAHAENRVREAKVNHYNGRRQLAVNHAAVAYGASDGTAIYNGAPGTGVGGYGYGAYGYGAAPYGAAGYGVGYAAPARAGYGYGGYAGGRVGYGGLGYW